MFGSRKYPYPTPPPHGGSRKFRGVGVSEIGKFPKGRGATQRVSFQYFSRAIVLSQPIQVTKPTEMFHLLK